MNIDDGKAYGDVCHMHAKLTPPPPADTATPLPGSSLLVCIRAAGKLKIVVNYNPRV